jgi:hypothetical protein
MSVDKRVQRVTDTAQQQRDTYLYWQSLPVGDRLSAVWDVSEAAYSFAAAFKGAPTDDAEGSDRAVTRIQPQRYEFDGKLILNNLQAHG